MKKYAFDVSFLFHNLELRFRRCLSYIAGASPPVFEFHFTGTTHNFLLKPPRPGGSVVSVSDSRPGDCEFDPG